MITLNQSWLQQKRTLFRDSTTYKQ